MSLDIITLHPDCKDRESFERINKEAFPSWERMRFDDIFKFSFVTNTDVLGIYDNGNPIGFTVLLKNEECGYVYYFAIDSHLRCHGYGGAAMKKLMEQYPGLQLVLDFEMLDETVENNEQRIRRKNFYLRNGFHETGYYTLLSGERFELVCNKGNLQIEAMKDLLRILHQHRPEFPEVLGEIEK